MEIKDRIRMVIESHRLTAGAFADKIGVQRSNVSHVLSGRNKPSFEFIEKMLLAFPKVQAHWLLTGKQQIAGEQEQRAINLKQPVLDHDEDQPSYQQPVTKKDVNTFKKIVKMVTFYDDFTFDTYTPNEQ